MSFPFQNIALPLRTRVQDLLSRLTLEEKLYLLSTHHRAIERFGLSEWFVGQEVARGYVSRQPGEYSTVFPQPIGMASTFDPCLMEEIGEITGIEARYYYRQDPIGHLMVWGPTVDPERDPRWGRTEEAYGEDPFLIGEMTAAYTKGMAGDDPTYRRVIPTLKHFCANNTEKHRGTDSSNITPRTLHEYYYRAFEGAIVRGGAGSVMTAYNELAGVPACMNPDLQHVLKDQWGLDFVVTDGADFSQNVLAHHSHATHAEALAACLHSGCDVMTDDQEMVAAAARDALDRNLITEHDVDKAVGNALYGRFQLGQLDGDACVYNTEPVEIDTPMHRMVNLAATREQMCLLQNDGILPLQLQSNQKVAVIGPLGNENYRDWYTGQFSYATSILEGLREKLGSDRVLWDDGYDTVALQSIENGKYVSVSADGTLCAVADQIGEREQFQWHDWGWRHVNLKAICNGRYVIEDGKYKATSETPYEWFIKEWLKPTKIGENLRFESWHERPMDLVTQPDGTLCCMPHGRTTGDRLFRMEKCEDGIARAAKLAAEADIVILCVGNHPLQVAKECYDRSSLELAPHQKALIQAVQKANPNTVLTVVASYPYALKQECDMLPAILYTTHAGAELGRAVAETLVGENNPAARCPITWYQSAEDLPSIREYDIIEAERTYLYDKTEPLFPFGHGLSYAAFCYQDFTAKQVDEGVVFRLSLTNTSARDGDEVVQLYFHADTSVMKRPIRQLCGFQRIFVPAGETVPVEIFVPWYALTCYDVTQERTLVEAGTYTFWAASSSLN